MLNFISDIFVDQFIFSNAHVNFNGEILPISAEHSQGSLYSLNLKHVVSEVDPNTLFFLLHVHGVIPSDFFSSWKSFFLSATAGRQAACLFLLRVMIPILNVDECAVMESVAN